MGLFAALDRAPCPQRGLKGEILLMRIEAE